MTYFIVGVPKAGNHLLRHVLGLKHKDSELVYLADEGEGGVVNRMVRVRTYPGGDISGHIAYSQAREYFSQNYTCIFLRRDLRDVVVSWAHYLDFCPENSWAWMNGEIDPVADRIAHIIQKGKGFLHDFAGWMDTDFIKITYEGLMTDPATELAPLAEMGTRPLWEMVERARWRGGKTYRKAKLGEWKKEFTDGHVQMFYDNYYYLMRALDYEI